MKFKHHFTGDDALTKTLKALPDAISHDVAIAALKEAAEPMRARAAALAPRGDGKGVTLAESIIATETTRVRGFGGGGKWRDVREGESVVAIGPSYRPADAFYGAFQEHGTAHHAAQPFLRPAFDAERKHVQKRLGVLIWAAIVRALKGLASHG